MSPGRRKADTGLGWVLANWFPLVMLLGWLITGTAAWVHLKDDDRARDLQQQRFQDRMDFHFGKEW